MPYRGGAYSNLVGHINVDYFDTETGISTPTPAHPDGVTAYRGSSRTGPKPLRNISSRPATNTPCPARRPVRNHEFRLGGER